MSDVAVDHLASSEITQEPSKAAVALVTLALAVGGFGIGTGEFVVMGLLPDVAGAFDVTTPQAGHVISAYALGVVIGAPVIAALAAKLSRRTLLLLLMTVFALGNIASALAPTFASFTILRFITGLPHGAYFGVAALVAASMVPAQRRARAVGQVMLGLTIATLVGTPVATFLGQLLSWRAAFMMVGAIGALTVLLIALFQPKDEVEEGASILRELGALRRVQVWLALAMAAVGFGGMFSIFTYIASTTTDVAGMPARMVPIVLALFGIGMNVGNIVGSRLADISLKGTIGGMLVFNIVVMVAVFADSRKPADAVHLRVPDRLRLCRLPGRPDAADGCRRRRADACRRLQPFGVQYRQRARRLARRARHRLGLHRCRDRLCRRGPVVRRPSGLCLRRCSRAAAASTPDPDEKLVRHCGINLFGHLTFLHAGAISRPWKTACFHAD